MGRSSHPLPLSTDNPRRALLDKSVAVKGHKGSIEDDDESSMDQSQTNLLKGDILGKHQRRLSYKTLYPERKWSKKAYNPEVLSK